MAGDVRLQHRSQPRPGPASNERVGALVWVHVPGNEVTGAVAADRFSDRALEIEERDRRRVGNRLQPLVDAGRVAKVVEADQI